MSTSFRSVPRDCLVSGRQRDSSRRRDSTLLLPPRRGDPKAGVNRPELLPKTDGASTPVIDVARILTPSQERELAADIAEIEKTAQVRLRVLTQTFPNTPGLAIKDYWKPDARTVIYVHDTGGLGETAVVNFNAGQEVELMKPLSYWRQVQNTYGNKYYIKEHGDSDTVVDVVGWQPTSAHVEVVSGKSLTLLYTYHLCPVGAELIVVRVAIGNQERLNRGTAFRVQFANVLEDVHICDEMDSDGPHSAWLPVHGSSTKVLCRSKWNGVNGASMLIASPPPGLEPDLGAAAFRAEVTATEVRPMTVEALEQKLKGLGQNASREAILEAIRELVLSEVEFKVHEKSEEMLIKGKQVVAQMQHRHREKTQQLHEEIDRCQKKQQELESENGRLKQTLQELASQFTLIGNTYLNGLNGKEMASPDSVSTADADTEPTQALPLTPKPYGERVDGLPEVPNFPFTPVPVAGCSPPAISIAESLGPRTPQRTPVSLLQSLTPSAAVPPSPFTVNGFASPGLVAGCGIFSFTLRKADGTDLGLNVSHNMEDRCLCVESIREGGAIEAWNRQCGLGTPFAEKAVFHGDKIISVNHVCYDPNAMLQECRDKQLLKLTIARGNVPLPAPPQELRAEASEFVPGSATKEEEKENEDGPAGC
ncbi:Thylakoid lumenal 15.0 kDa protein 2 [Durusdinium trenchii]|uniref:Chloroplastic n=1 Tax=Durusdinium trenchii TaxID=1381693 RepID=A0ABP0MQQ2_9DINO